MRATTKVAAAAVAVLTASIGSVAPAVAAPAAVTSAPLVYTTYVQTADGGNANRVAAVGYDGSGRRNLATTALVISDNGNGGSDINGTEVVGPAATYSVDHTRVAWTESDWTPATVAYAVKVVNVATRAVATFPLPAGSVVGQGGAYLAWYADNTRIAMVLDTGSTPTVTTLDTATGTFTPVSTLASDDRVVSLAVSADGTIAFTANAGVAVLIGASSTPKYLYRVGTDEYCTTVRTRPGSAREFTYVCTKYGTPGQQVLRSQTPAGAGRTIYSADTTAGTSPVTFLEGFTWSPSGTSLALLTTSVRAVNVRRCVNAMTTTLSTVNSNGAAHKVLQTEPTITAQTCKGNDWGDIDRVAWSADAQTVVFTHATRFFGPMSAFAVRPAAPQTQTVLATSVIDLSS